MAADLPVPRVVRPVAPTSARRAEIRIVAAPFWRRSIAGFIDVALVAGVAVALGWSGALAIPTLTPRSYDWIDHILMLLWREWPALWPYAAGFVGGAIAYGIALHSVAERTLGELVCGLRLIRRDGRAPGPVRSVLHAIGTAVGLALLLLGFAWAAVDPRRQTLAEYLSGTYLIAGHPE